MREYPPLSLTDFATFGSGWGFLFYACTWFKSQMIPQVYNKKSSFVLRTFPHSQPCLPEAAAFVSIADSSDIHLHVLNNMLWLLFLDFFFNLTLYFCHPGRRGFFLPSYTTPTILIPIHTLTHTHLAHTFSSPSTSRPHASHKVTSYFLVRLIFNVYFIVTAFSLLMSCGIMKFLFLYNFVSPGVNSCLIFSFA